LEALLESATTMAYGAPSDVTAAAQRLLLPLANIDIEAQAREVQALQFRVRAPPALPPPACERPPPPPPLSPPQTPPEEGPGGGGAAATWSGGGPGGGAVAALGSTDVAGFMTRMHRAVTGAVVAESAATCTAYLQAAVGACVEAEWEVAKAELLGALGLGLGLGAPGTSSVADGGYALAAVGGDARRDAAAAVPAFVPTAADGGAAGSGAAVPVAQRWGFGSRDASPPAAVDGVAAQYAAVTQAVAAHGLACEHNRQHPTRDGGMHPVLAFGQVAEATAPASTAADASAASPLVRLWSWLLEVTREGMAAGAGWRTYADAYRADPLAAVATAHRARPPVADVEEVAAGARAEGSRDDAGASATLVSGGLRTSEPAPAVPADLHMSAGLAQHWAMGSWQHAALVFDALLQSTVAAERAARAGSAAAAGSYGGGLPQASDLSHPSDATLPPVLATVRAYVRLLLVRHAQTVAASNPGAVSSGEEAAPAWCTWALRDGIVYHGLPLFPQLYLLLRCGAVPEAVAVADEAAAALRSAPGGLGRVIASAASALAAYAEFLQAVAADTGRADGAGVATTVAAARHVSDWQRAASAGTATRQRAALDAMVACGHEFAACVAAEGGAAHARAGGGAGAAAAPRSEDPWFAEVMCLLSGGVGGVADRSDDTLLVGVQDYLWHRLWCAITAPLADAAAAAAGRKPAEAYYTLQQLAGDVLSYGVGHFDPRGDQAYQYAELLLMVGHPEAAVTHLLTRGAAR
jgi:hypothetical protein